MPIIVQGLTKKKRIGLLLILDSMPIIVQGLTEKNGLDDCLYFHAGQGLQPNATPDLSQITNKSTWIYFTAGLNPKNNYKDNL
jgi:hypothetical protein